MTSNKKKAAVLNDHRRIGKKLIPPMMLIPNIVETSFRDTKIPELIWMSAIFKRSSDRAAVNGIIEFLISCNEAISDDQLPQLSFLSNFGKLSNEHKGAILADANCKKKITFLQSHLVHQCALLDRYPLAFIFPERPVIDKNEAVHILKEDVESILDRYSKFAAKVQTTAIVGMMAMGKMYLNKDMDFPDPNCIFTSPDSDEAKRIAAFARATLNAGAGLEPKADNEKLWANDFWDQAFLLEGCE